MVKYRIFIIISIIIVLNMICLNINFVQAAGIDDVVNGASSFIKDGEVNSTAKINETDLKDASTSIYNILLALGVTIAVVMTGIIGIKFMIGSAEEKAQIKEVIIPFIIGCIVIFGAFGIWKIFVTIGNHL